MKINNRFNIGDTVYFNQKNVVGHEDDEMIKDTIFAVCGSQWVNEDTGELEQSVWYTMEDFYYPDVKEEFVFGTEAEALKILRGEK